MIKFYRQFSQTESGGQTIWLIRFVIILVGFFSLLEFGGLNKPLPDRIETAFAMTLPDNARDFGWHSYNWEGYYTLARFTVDLEDLEPTLQSVRWNTEERCIREPREDGFMPIFSRHPEFSWWRPHDAKIFDGVMCQHYNPNGLAPNYGILVDYGVREGEAVVYIEEFSINAEGIRAGWSYD